QETIFAMAYATSLVCGSLGYFADHHRMSQRAIAVSEAHQWSCEQAFSLYMYIYPLLTFYHAAHYPDYEVYAGPLLKEAGPVIEKGLQIAEDIDHPWLFGFGNLNLGMLKLRVGDLTDAKAAFSTGLHMLRDLPARSAVLYWL